MSKIPEDQQCKCAEGDRKPKGAQLVATTQPRADRLHSVADLTMV